MADTLNQIFEERLQEIDAYLDLLEALERQVREGPPKIGGASITAQQQKILYSSVYLQLYNLVEATANWCIEAVCAAAADNGRWQPGDLSVDLLREWVRSTARTHVNLNEQHRLETAVKMCDRLIRALPVIEWTVERSGGGWDDEELVGIARRLGFNLQVSQEAYRGIKRPIREDKGPLVLVRYLRNQLAHGSLSFAECGDGVTVDELKTLKQRTADFLREVVSAFKAYIDGHEFLAPERRPVPPAPV